MITTLMRHLTSPCWTGSCTSGEERSTIFALQIQLILDVADMPSSDSSLFQVFKPSSISIFRLESSCCCAHIYTQTFFFFFCLYSSYLTQLFVYLLSQVSKQTFSSLNCFLTRLTTGHTSILNQMGPWIIDSTSPCLMVAHE